MKRKFAIAALILAASIARPAPADQFFSSPATAQAAAFVRGDLVL